MSTLSTWFRVECLASSFSSRLWTPLFIPSFRLLITLLHGLLRFYFIFFLSFSILLFLFTSHFFGSPFFFFGCALFFFSRALISKVALSADNRVLFSLLSLSLPLSKANVAQLTSSKRVVDTRINARATACQTCNCKSARARVLPWKRKRSATCPVIRVT